MKSGCQRIVAIECREAKRRWQNAGVLHILAVTFPFFALVLAGFAATHRGLLPLPAIPGLNAFVLYFALPCMLFRFGAGTPIGQLLDPGVFGVYLFCALVVVAFAIAVTLGPRTGWNDAAFGALTAAFPNTGFMGVPLLVALFGARAAGPTIVTIVVDLVITSSLCIALSRLDASDAQGAGDAAKKALRGVVANPLPWSIILGGLMSAFELALPGPLMATIGLLADAASPVALFTIGAVLARSQLSEEEAHSAKVPLADVLPVAVGKLVLHPLLVLFVGSTAVKLGVPIGRFTLAIMVLVAALPSASNVVLLAERYGANSARIARIILLSTALAFFTFSGAAALLSPGL